MFDTELIGQTLLKRGFKAFFLYLFNVIEGRKFIVEPLHRQLFDYFQNIYDGKVQRCNINICPRSAKTTLAQYFLVYTITINPKAQIIYTSYSQSLLSEISSKIVSILENPIYKALYPHNTSNIEKEELNPIDDFWKNYLFEDTGKNVYSSKIIKTYAGGLCLFNSIGASITGYGAGLRNSKKFSGCLIIDDANKPADVRSQTMRNRVLRYFEETLLSRLNNPDTPIINIQQRLHVEDLSGILADKYNFDVLRIPLLDDNGNCLIPSQYTQERIKELKINNYMFQAQYMQNPIIAEGEVINPDWFTYYPIDVDYNYDKIVISADTAMTVKEASDYTCFMVGGVTKDNKLHILEVVHGKFEYPVLRQQAIDLYNRWQRDIDHASASAMFIENKASGISLIQDLKTAGLPVVPIDVTKDKLARVEEVLNYIATGLVMLPVSKTYGTNPELLAECQAFTRDDSHLHDDMCLVGNTKIATLLGDKYIKDIKEGDYVITPYGINKVLKSVCTGYREVITKKGITGTDNHKIFMNGKFDKLINLGYDVQVDTLTLKGLILWKYKKLLSLMVLNTNLWGRKDIIYLNQIQIKDGKVLKDCMLQFGNFIVDKKYQKAMLFIIKTVILLITSFLIWNVYQGMNILKNISNFVQNLIKDLNKLNILKKLGNLHQNGIKAKTVKNGIGNMLKIHLQKHGNGEKNENVQYAVKNILQKCNIQNIVVNNAEQKHIELEKVYNITIDKAQVYYANKILVSNCDSLVHLINNTIAHRQISLLDVL